MADKWTVVGIEFLRVNPNDSSDVLRDANGNPYEIIHGEEVTKGETETEEIGNLKLKWTEITGVKEKKKKGYVDDTQIVPLVEGTLDPTESKIFDEEVDFLRFAEACVRNARRWRTNSAFLFALAHVESSGSWKNKKVSGPVDPTSGATGAYQFLPERWAELVEEHGAEQDVIEEFIKFPEPQCTFAAIEAQRNSSQIQGFTGRPVSAVDLYIAHLFGAKGAISILDAEQKNENEKIEAILKALYGGDQAKVDAISQRKPALLTANGPVTVAKFLQRCAKSLNAAFAKVKKIAEALAPETPADAESDLGGVGSSSPQAARIVEVAKKYVGRPYKNIRVDYTDPDWSGAFDCAEYATYCTYRVFARLYGTTNNNDIAKADAYTGAWKTDSANLGNRIPWKDALKIPGAFVLRYPPSQGAMGHIGVSEGDGKHIYEARGTSLGVGRFSALGRSWDTGVTLPFAAHGDEPASEMTAFEYRFRSPPMGPDNNIKAIERALHEKGFLAAAAIDGIFDEALGKAVEAFQKANGLIVDGVVGAKTGGALLGEAAWEAMQAEADEFQIPSTGDNDLLALARTVFGEARNQSETGKVAVAHVVLNRLKDGRFPLNPGVPKTVAGICLDPWQFSCWNKNDPNRSKIVNLPLNSTNAAFKKCLAAVKGVLSGAVPDPTGDATHYFADSIPTPAWVHDSPKAVKSATIGKHIFYRGIK